MANETTVFVPSTDEDILTVVNDRFLLASGSLEKNRLKWRELIDMYELGSARNLWDAQDERNPGRTRNVDQSISRMNSSVLWNAVETIAPRMMSLFNMNDGWFNPVALPGTTQKSADEVKKKLDMQMEEEFYRTIWTAVRQAVKLGVAVIKVRWDVERGKIHEDIPVFRNGEHTGFRRTSTDGVTFWGNKIDLVPYWNFYPDPKGRFLDECDYVIEEIIVPFAEIQRLADEGIYDQDAVAKLKEQIPDTGNDPRSDRNDFYFEVDRHRHNVVLKDYWEDKAHYVVGMAHAGTGVSNGIILNKFRENPHDHQLKPYVDLRITTHEKHFFSNGIIEPLRDNHNVQSTMLNMFMDTVTMNLRTQKIVDGDLEVDWNDIQNFVPNRVLKLDNPYGQPIANAIFEFKPDAQSILGALIPGMSMMKNEGQETSGVTDFITGQASVGANKTASGAALLTQNAEQRHFSPMMLLGLGATRLLKLMHTNNQQFGHPQEDIYGRYRWMVFGDSQVDRQTRLQGLQVLLPFIAQVGGNVKEVLKRMAKAFGIPDIESLLPEDGTMELQQMQNGIAQMQQQLSEQQQNAQ